MRKVAQICLATLILLMAGVWLAVPIDPVSWKPAPDPGLAGEFAPNTKLADIERLLEGEGVGPEDVACGAGGKLYTGLHDGRILVFSPEGDSRELANTGGRPLGMQLDGAGNLIVADAARGLLSVSPKGEVRVLTDTVDGAKIKFADDLDIADDGTVWFSDASTRHDYHDSLHDFLEGRRTGRLLSYSPATGETRVRMDGLFFANGVALGPNDEFVLVNETGAGRIHRMWLTGERAGRRDLFHAGLPGTPDNLSFNGKDTFWVAMPALRPGIDSMAEKPFVRKVLSLLPMEVLHAGTAGYSFVVGLGLDGSVRHNLQDEDAGFSKITSANECGEHIYLGSLTMPAVGRYPTPEAARATALPIGVGQARD